MKVLLCFAMLVVAQTMGRAAIPGHLRDWSQIRERWPEADPNWVPLTPNNPPILRTGTKDFRAVCGKPNLSDSRIVSGTEATPNEYPWVVALFMSGGTFCTGSLISDEWVLTAAHCLDGRLLRYVDVYLGAHYVQRPAGLDGNRTELRANNGSWTIHPTWNPNLIIGDLALLRLPEKVDITGDKIRPICLPSTAGGDKTGLTAQLAGWGKVSDTSSSISPTLQKATATIISNSVCNDTYTIITDKIICTSVKPSGTCNGDSGGPMTILENNVHIQNGICSFGSSAGCESGAPDAFTRVDQFLGWIQSETGIKVY